MLLLSTAERGHDSDRVGDLHVAGAHGVFDGDELDVLFAVGVEVCLEDEAVEAARVALLPDAGEVVHGRERHHVCGGAVSARAMADAEPVTGA